MIKEFCNARLKKTGKTGTVVDISEINGATKIIFECDEENISNGYGPENRLVDCTEDELEIID